MQNLENILDRVEVTLDHASFYPRVITSILRAKKGEASELDAICSEEYDDLSRRLDRTQLQESASVRNCIKARLIATKLVRDEGSLDEELLQKFIASMQKNLFSLAPEHSFDVVRDQHILHVLTELRDKKELRRLLSHISRPLQNRPVESVIRETLHLPREIPITDAHVRRACLAAWLTFLRQSLGSCFATAPAILVQKEQPEAFLRDLDEMMSTGCLKRTYGGVEYQVPMSETWGNGDLRKPFFLERTLIHNENKVWMSPGLIEALSHTAVLKEELPFGKKAHLLQGLLQKSLSLLETAGHILLTNAEELIRVLLLSHYGVTRKEVDEYLMRPKTMVHGGLFTPTPQKRGKAFKSKENPIPLFLEDFGRAKTAFKLLADNPLLKTWEFTLASFSEINLDFCRWNLYSSLGMNYDDVGGIGHCLYQYISQKVEQAKVALDSLQIEYEQVLAQAHYLEGRIRSASTDKEIDWIKMEYQSCQTELYHIDQLRLQAHGRATKVAGLYEFLMREYDSLFFRYFQEVYDAEIHDVASGPFDDSPAGFRLLYKHGRSNPALWSRIHTPSEFSEALVSFFTITEVELREHPSVKGIENELTNAISHLVQHVRSEEFLVSSFYRMAKAHGVGCPEHPLENLDKVEKKPWVYTSGGSMSTLVSAYFRREEKPTEIARWVENETELLAFFIDTIKQQPASISDPYLQDVTKSMLIHSPTHAFLLKPGLFQGAWKSDLYTYSWIKHALVEPAQEFIKELYVDEEMGQDLVQELLFSIPQDFRPRFKQLFQKLPFRLAPIDFRSYLVDVAQSDRGMRSMYGPVLSSDIVDGFLLSHLPYTPKEKLREILFELLTALFPEKVQDIPEIVQMGVHRMTHRGVISAKKLLDVTKALSALLLQNTRTEKNIHQLCVEALRVKKLMMPAPLLVADSNWVKDYFAFIVSPATGDLEFWSVDFFGTQGKPISYWKMWLNGSRKEPQWGIYYKPHEYVKNALAIQRKF